MATRNKDELLGYAPDPPTPLGRYRALSPLAGVRVSPMQLGGMSIGDEWAKYGMGAMDKESSLKLPDASYEAGDNFIDTSCNYQKETSEKLIGEWAEQRGIRNELVIATKYTTHYKRVDDRIKIKANYVGNNAKSLFLSVEDSLRKLRTTYIDIFRTQGPLSRNIRHSCMGRRFQYAKLAHQTPFVVYQGAWNVMDRSFEREIIPMARSLGLVLAPWNVLAAGRLRTDAEEEKRLATGEEGRTLFLSDWKRNEDEKKTGAALGKVAKEVGTEHITAVAIAYVMQKTPYVFPIIGGRKKSKSKYLESILPFDLGFPHTAFGNGTQSVPYLIENAAREDKVPLRQSIKPKISN
ncbi:AAD14_3 [Sanghuangporus vaninii]